MSAMVVFERQVLGDVNVRPCRHRCRLYHLDRGMQNARRDPHREAKEQFIFVSSILTRIVIVRRFVYLL